MKYLFTFLILLALPFSVSFGQSFKPPVTVSTPIGGGGGAEEAATNAEFISAALEKRRSRRT